MQDLSGIDVSEKADKVSKTTNALDIQKFSAVVQYFLSWRVTNRVVNFPLQMKIISASKAELTDMAKNGFQKSFDGLYKLRQKSAVAQGFYFEGGYVSAT
ncbi:hypothetical protein TNCV_2879731 [Trichonephila clavipes]|uniref:Uncharacterized protein n=1 Tax=Trichonephila clavipes TaxID=2585209 RepID=A0A8X6W1R5_TRICX|nr:hypothetical protein TNCV_2879731 [Trichonephila clavipes]